MEALSDIPVRSHIWHRAQLSIHKLPPPHALLFGTFRAVDFYIETCAPHQADSRTCSYIDFAYGSDDGFIAGVHRFSVSRTWIDETKSERNVDSTTSVTIEFAHSGCNPRGKYPLKPDALQMLHSWYAMLLFREGVAELMKGQ